MQRRGTARSTIMNATSYELKLVLRGILFPAALAFFFIYVMISIIDTDRTGFYNSMPSSIILAIGIAASLKLVFYTKLEKIEIHRFRFVFLALICWLIGELIYLYHQALLAIAVPYPSIADIFYLSATVFLSFHFYNILHLKKNILKKKSFIYLGFLASVFPIYLLIDTVYHFGDYYPDSIIEFLVNVSYYASDAVVIFPCIPIILSLRKNDPFVFHWLLVTLSVSILVAADLGYTFIASADENLLTNIEWLWSFFYSIGYLLLTLSILWFSKIKEILEYKRFSEVLRYDSEDVLDNSDKQSESIAKLENSNQILKSMTSISDKAKEQIDILFAEYVLQRREIIGFINIMIDKAKKNKLLNVRILLPSPKLDEVQIPSNVSSNVSIKYFDRHLTTNTITSILDSELLYTIGSESEYVNGSNKYFIRHINNESKILVSIALFERMWLLEKPVDFG
jgi:hypothetical protein